MTPKLVSLLYTFSHGGRHPLWHARHPNFPHIIGAGGSAELAGRDWQKTYRLLQARREADILRGTLQGETSARSSAAQPTAIGIVARVSGDVVHPQRVHGPVSISYSYPQAGGNG